MQPEYRFIYEDIQQKRGFDLVFLERFNEAVPVLSECLSFKLPRKDMSNVLANLGICYSELEDHEKALECLLKGKDMGLFKEVADTFIRMLLVLTPASAFCMKRNVNFSTARHGRWSLKLIFSRSIAG
jgi:hypothetical protein